MWTLRNGFAVLLGVALIVGLGALFGAIELSFADSHLATDLAGQGPAMQILRERPERVFDTLRMSLFRARFLYGPIIAFLVALVAGLVAKESKRVVVLLAVIPLLFITYDRESSALLAVGLSSLYVGVALLVAEVLHRRSSAKPPLGPTTMPTTEPGRKGR